MSTTGRGDDYLCTGDTKTKVVVRIELVAAGSSKVIVKWGSPTLNLFSITSPTAPYDTKDSQDRNEANIDDKSLDFQRPTTSLMQPT